MDLYQFHLLRFSLYWLKVITILNGKLEMSNEKTCVIFYFAICLTF